MTFAELAEVRRISKASAIKLIRRHGWRRQRDNKGHVRALVPLPWLEGNEQQEPDTQPDNLGDREAYSPAEIPGLSRVISAFEAAVTSITLLAENTEKRADRAEIRAESAESRVNQAELDLSAERNQAERLKSELEKAQISQGEAEADAAELRVRLDAAEASVERAEQDLATERKRAETAAAELRQAEAAVQKAEQDRTAAVAMADEAVRAAEELRQADAKRAGEGRWKRLRAAWRGQ